jgi:peptidoglycan hydrolase CwlO-like protein
MLDTSTLYLILALGLFVFVSVIIIHQHNCSDSIARKQHSTESIVQQFTQKTKTLELEVEDLKTQIEEIDEKFDTFQA